MTATKGELVLGELTGESPWREVPCSVPGVRARETVRKGKSCTITERLYECPNGWALGVRRGGPLHLAGDDTWELFVLTPWRVASGKAVGYIDNETVERALRKLSSHREPWQSPFTGGRCAA